MPLSDNKIDHTSCMISHHHTLTEWTGPDDSSPVIEGFKLEQGDVELVALGADDTPCIGIGAGTTNDGLGQGDGVVLDACAAANCKDAAGWEVAGPVDDVAARPVCEQQTGEIFSLEHVCVSRAARGCQQGQSLWEVQLP